MTVERWIAIREAWANYIATDPEDAPDADLVGMVDEAIEALRHHLERPPGPRAKVSPPPRLPCGCPLDSGCTGHHPSTP